MSSCSEAPPHLICDGEFEIIKITEDLYDEAVKLFQENFMKTENICTACNLNGTEQSIREMETLVRAMLIDQISFAARHCSSKKMAAICVNKVLNPSADSHLASVFDRFRAPGMIVVGALLDRMETTFDIFKEWSIDCAMEIVFLSTCKEFTGRGLATLLSQHSVDFARRMMNGTLPEVEKLPAHIRSLKPKAVCSVFTSKFSQKVGDKIGLKILFRVPFEEFSFEGRNFRELIDPIHEFCAYAAVKL